MWITGPLAPRLSVALLRVCQDCLSVLPVPIIASLGLLVSLLQRQGDLHSRGSGGVCRELIHRYALSFGLNSFVEMDLQAIQMVPD